MRLCLTLIPALLSAIFVSGCQSTTSQLEEINYSSVKASINNLDLWSQQFVGLSKKDAIEKLQNLDIKEEELKGKNNKVKIKLVATLPNGKLSLYLSPINQKVLTSAIFISKNNSVSKIKS
jgi:hypothetical protein